MGTQVLGDRWIRRIARLTGLEIVRGWSSGGYVHGFVDRLHRHGSINATSHEWRLHTFREQLGMTHYSSCCQFPDSPSYGKDHAVEFLERNGLEPVVWTQADWAERAAWRRESLETYGHRLGTVSST
jgi:hypothetical protein